MKKKKTKASNSYEVNRRIRRDWGLVQPYTRIEEDKRKKKPKHKEDWELE